MNVLVTGASGFVGEAVLKELEKAGHTMAILARRPHASRIRALAERYHLRIIAGDLLGGAEWHRGLKGTEAVVHLVGIISESGRATFEKVHTEGTRRVITGMQTAGVRRLVHMSALGTRPQAVSRYHQTKWAAEELVRKSGLDFTIFRPSIIYGPRDQFVNQFARISRFSPVLPVIGSGTVKMQPVAVEAVAQAFTRAVSEPRAIVRAFDLCGLEVLTFNAILDQIMAVTGRKRLKVHIPLSVAYFSANLMEHFFPAVLRTAPPLNRDQIIMLQEDNSGDPYPAADLFDLPLIAFRQGIAKYLKPRLG